MISGLEKILSRRMWFVPRYMVWGLPGFGDIEIAVIETVQGNDTIYFGRFDAGDPAQHVSYSELRDFRGNNLPSSITNPRVMPRSRSADAVLVVGDETSTDFKLARDPQAEGPVEADLLVIEMND